MSAQNEIAPASRHEQNRTAGGQYAYDKLSRVCKCGLTLGNHLAVHPFPSEDDECERFRPAKVDGKFIYA